MTPAIPEGNVDLGNGFSYRVFPWAPDRDIPSNATLYADIADIAEAGIGVYYGDRQWGFCNFDTSAVRAVFGGHVWQVIQREPLTITPSILCRSTGLHGYITGGRWVDCWDNTEAIRKVQGLTD